MRAAIADFSNSFGRRMVAAAMVLLVLLGLTGTASAHNGKQSLVYLDVTATSLSGRVELAFGNITEVWGLEFSSDTESNQAILEENLATLQAYAGDHLAVGPQGGESWNLNFDGLEILIEEGETDINYALLPFTAVVGDEVPRDFEVTFDPFFDEIPGRDALLLIANDWENGIIENEEESLVAFDAGNRTRAVDLGDSSRWNNFSSSVELGLDHIRTGADHILFVLVLLLPSVLVFNNAWKPARSFGGSLWRVLKIATMFTIAHSITFTLAGLGILPLPSSKIIETIIAASIAAAAIHNIRPVFPNREWLLAFAFGLFHGMGFASLVSGLEVSRGTQLVSLLGRNVGIEIGQAFVIVLVFPALFLLRRTLSYKPVFVTGSLALTVISMAWMVERVFETDLGTNTLVEKFVRFPRSVGLVAIATALAAGYYLVESRRKRLLDAVPG